MNENELLSLRNFGQKSLVELREKLREHGVLPDTGEDAGGAAGAALGANLEDEAADGATPGPSAAGAPAVAYASDEA
jgi:hypothetical protein